MKTCLLWLVPSVAFAHVVSFEFVVPQGAQTGATEVPVQWTAGPDPTGAAEFSLYASRGGTPPFSRFPTLDAVIEGNSLPISGGVRSWNVSGLTPGCYQPLAMVNDQLEGTSYRLANAVVGVGVQQPVALVTSPASVPPVGALTLRVEAAGAGQVELSWRHADAGMIPFKRLTFDGGVAQVDVPVVEAEVPQDRPLYLSVRTGSCETWWTGALYRTFDGGTGVDAGRSLDGGAPAIPTRGCGCSSGSEASTLLLVVGASLLVRRRSGRRDYGI